MDASLVGQQTATQTAPSLKNSDASSENADLATHPPSQTTAFLAPAGGLAPGRAESLPAQPAQELPPQIQSFLRGFVSKHVAESPQAERAARGRRTYFP